MGAGHLDQESAFDLVFGLGVLDEDDAVFQTRVGAFLQGLALLGWTIGRNVRIETRWSGGKADEARRYAAELVALAPDVILAGHLSMQFA